MANFPVLEFLRSVGFLHDEYGENYNMPKREYVEDGLFKISKRIETDDDSGAGVVIIEKTMSITEKGISEIMQCFCNNLIEYEG